VPPAPTWKNAGSMASVHREPGGSTLADLEAMPGDDGRRYELIDGNIIVSPWPAHYGGISFHLGPILAHAVPAEHASYRLCGLDLPGEQRVIPDLVVAPHSSIGDQRLRLPVLLVVEILCGLESRDLILKRTAYAAAGVPAYWLIDPDASTITCMRLEGDDYTTYAEGAVVDVDWPFPVRVDVAAVNLPGHS
jgi:Uma2 family endonuclease